MERSAPAADWVILARLVKPWGHRGELAADSFCRGAQRFDQCRDVTLRGPAWPEGRAAHIESVREHQGRLIFRFRGIDSVGAAQPLVNCEVCVPMAQRATPGEGEYFQSDLIGCRVLLAADGTCAGAVRGVVNYGGTDLLELDSGPLIPFVRAICVEIDPAAGRIVIDPPEGLLELNR